MCKLDIVLSIFLDLDIWREPFDWGHFPNVEESDWERLEGAAQDLISRLAELGVEGLPNEDQLLEAFKKEVKNWR